MHTETYSRSLPLLAAALSGQRGIRVEIGGDKACTDGATIRLPSLPLDMDDALLGVARGFLDHESAHILFSAFDALKDAGLTPLERYFANAIEDVRVETAMARRFPGCARNFRETARHVFLDAAKASGDPAGIVPSYVLLRLRRETCPELAGLAAKASLDVARLFPGLLPRLELVFADLAASCPDTQAAIAFGRRFAALLRDYQEHKGNKDTEVQKQDGGGNGEGQAGAVTGDGKEEAGAPAEETADTDTSGVSASLAPLFGDDAEDLLPRGMGEALSDELEASRSCCTDETVLSAVEVPAEGSFRLMPKDMLDKVLRLQASLRPMLRGVLQADTLEGRMPAVRGKLNGRKLYAVPLGDQHVFTRHVPAKLLSTGLHILIDRSGSTTGFIDDAAVSAYAVAHAASGIRGVSVGMSAFPVAYPGEYNTGQPGVATLLRHGQVATFCRAFGAGGCTPLAEAVWHVLPMLMRQKGPRRMLLLFSDGIPDSMPKAEAALRDASSLGIEAYGVAYRSGSLAQLLGDNRTIVIQNIEELPGALAAMLLTALRRAS